MAGQIWTSWTAYNPNFGYENAVIFFPNVIVGNPNLTLTKGKPHDAKTCSELTELSWQFIYAYALNKKICSINKQYIY